MRMAGIVIFIVGLLMTVYTGFTYVTTEKIVDLGDIEITNDEEHSVNWQPYVGVGAMVIGGALFLLDKKKTLT